MPEEVRQWCADHAIPTHCDHTIHDIEDDGNPFAEWLKSLGFAFAEDQVNWVGIFGT